MKIAVPLESAAGESRVAISPDAVKAYVKKGLTVCIEQGAGAGSFMSDDAFKAAGAKIAKGAAVLKDADIVLAVRRLPDASLKSLKKGAIVAAQLDPHGDRRPQPGS